MDPDWQLASWLYCVMDPDWQLASWLYCSTQGGSPGLKAKPTGLIPEFISIHRFVQRQGG